MLYCMRFQVLQVALSELFHARLGHAAGTNDEKSEDGLSSDTALGGLLLERVQKPGAGIFSEGVSFIYFDIFTSHFLRSCCQVIPGDVEDAAGSDQCARCNTFASVKFWKLGVLRAGGSWASAEIQGGFSVSSS